MVKKHECKPNLSLAVHCGDGTTYRNPHLIRKGGDPGKITQGWTAPCVKCGLAVQWSVSVRHGLTSDEPFISKEEKDRIIKEKQFDLFGD